MGLAPLSGSHAIQAIAITGPTASGKTAAALLLAQRLPIEVISVDSALVYRHMDIGTAKPSAQERQAVVHHLLDIREPFESYNAADFLKDAHVLVAQITARGHLPVFVGGTMLYLKCLVQGIDDMPPIDPRIRESLTARAVQIGWPALHQELAQLDPVTAARLSPNDSQRISRALEVVLGSGRPLSSLQTARTRGIAGLLDEHRIISLEPVNRQVLHQRIAARFEAMREAGFLHEALALFGQAQWNPELPAMRCVGYRQIFDLLLALKNQGVDCRQLSREQAHKLHHDWQETGSAATRQLAKRQLTWLRGMPQRTVIEMEAPDAAEQVCKAALDLLAATPQ